MCLQDGVFSQVTYKSGNRPSNVAKYWGSVHPPGDPASSGGGGGRPPTGSGRGRTGSQGGEVSTSDSGGKRSRPSPTGQPKRGRNQRDVTRRIASKRRRAVEVSTEETDLDEEAQTSPHVASRKSSSDRKHRLPRKKKPSCNDPPLQHERNKRQASAYKRPPKKTSKPTPKHRHTTIKRR